jgi:hypothetical protein
MAEIKSTLDLVMERTKHLALSSDEKQNQQRAEYQKKINGLLQKADDGVLTDEELFRAIDDLQAFQAKEVKKGLLLAVSSRLSIDRDNRVPLAVLKAYCGLDTASIEKILADYLGTRETEAQLRTETARQALAEKHHISGSAVVPHLGNDPNWIAKVSALKNEFQQRLDRETAKIGLSGQ